MKDKARLLISLIFISPLLALSVILLQGRVFAQSPNDPLSNQTSSDSLTNQSQAKIDARNKRLEDRKTKATIQLNQAQQTAIANSCRSAQVKIKDLGQKIKDVETHRTVTYKELIARLSSLNERLPGHLNTTEYGDQLEELKSKTEVFLKTIDTYKLEISDLDLMDCAADPTAFYATLEQSRASQKDLREQSQSLNSHLKDNLQPTLSNLASQLTTTNHHGAEEN